VLTPLAQIVERIDRARDDSDVAYFYELLFAGEMVVKLTTAGLLATLEDDRERHRYRLEFHLIRADSLGAWASALDDSLTGPASQVLPDEAQALQRELTQTFRLGGDEWQANAVRLLQDARRAVDTDLGPLPARVSVRRWFSDFVALRNRTRGHGATTPNVCSAACQPLNRSVTTLLENLTLFRLPWAHLHRNLSGKYRVTDLGNGAEPFAYLRTSKEYAHSNGVYLSLGCPRLVTLLATDDDVHDFFMPNGGLQARDTNCCRTSPTLVRPHRSTRTSIRPECCHPARRKVSVSSMLSATYLRICRPAFRDMSIESNLKMSFAGCC